MDPMGKGLLTIIVPFLVAFLGPDFLGGGGIWGCPLRFPWKNIVDGRNPKQPPGMYKTMG